MSKQIFGEFLYTISICLLFGEYLKYLNAQSVFTLDILFVATKSITWSYKEQRHSYTI